MHEYSIMSQLVSALIEELDDKHNNKVESVHIEVGELTFLEPDALEFAFSVLIKETVLEGSVLEVKTISSEIECESCGYKGPVNYSDDPTFHFNIPIVTCPRCDSKPKVTKGKETMIRSVTVSEEDHER